MEKKFENEYKLYLDTWGQESQERMAIEEMSELIKELCKKIRFERDDFGEEIPKEKKQKNIEAIKEEIADVLNMTEQLQYYYGIEEIDKIREEKIKRTTKLIKG